MMAIKPVSGEIKSQDINDNLSYLDNKLSQVNGGPLGSLGSVAELNQKYPNGANGFFIIDGHMYFWEGNEWVDRGVYQAKSVPYKSLTNEKIAEKAITPDEASFASLGINKFNGNYYEYVFFGGEGSVATPIFESGSSSAIVSVESNSTYYIYLDEIPDRFRIAFFNQHPLIGTGVITKIADGLKTIEVTTTTNTKYMMIYLKRSTSLQIPKDLMVEKGRKTGYKKTKTIIDLEDNSIISSQILGHLNQAIYTGLPTDLNVSLKNEEIRVLGNAPFINVGNERYVLKKQIYSFKNMNVNTILVFVNIFNRTLEFYALDSIPNDANLGYLGIIRRNVSCHFNGIYQLEDSDILQFTKKDKDKLNKNIEIADNLMKPCIFPKINSRYTSNSSFSPVYNSLDMLYGIYDSLVDKYPDYVTKSVFCVEETGLEVNRYDFKIPNIQKISNETGTTDIVIPKIVYTGTHAHEYQSQVSGAKFFTELCEKWKEVELLRTLRFNYHIIVIPTLNPWGILNEKRTNSNGVDINRNFPTDWIHRGEGTEYYSGPEPLSEIVSKKLYEFMTTEEGIKFAIDNHNANIDFSADLNPFWLGAKNEQTLKYCSGVTNALREIIETKYNPEDRKLVYKISDQVRSTVAGEFDATGNTGIILETVWRVEKSMELGQKMNMDTLGNTIAAMINFTAN